MNDNIPQLEHDGGCSTIRLCRPREHNRIDPLDIPVIHEYLDEILKRDQTRIVVFSAVGNKTFSSGYTIQAILKNLDHRFEALLDTIEHYPLPTLCALNGSVYGGATDLALCCDFRLGVRGSRMFMPAAKFGLHYYPGGLRRYISHLGLSQTKKLFLTAATIDDEEMKRIGFLTELVEHDQLPTRVNDYVEAIIACEPNVLMSLKRQINAIAAGDTAAAVCREDFETSLRSDELAQRLGGVKG